MDGGRRSGGVAFWRGGWKWGEEGSISRIEGWCTKRGTVGAGSASEEGAGR